MPLGIDFDNTIVSYDRIFVEAARARGWVADDFRGSKKQLRDAVRLLQDGEIKWQILQGEVYGQRMGEAEPFPGVLEFIRDARRRGIEMFIVSHKTRYSNYDSLKVDLRAAALAWMEKNAFFDSAGLGFSREQVFFADTRAEKIARIAALGCGLFIDDLEEVFADPAFPARVTRVLFTTDEEPGDRAIVVRRTWPDIARYVFEETKAGGDAAEDAAAIGGRLTGVALRSVEPVRAGGGNNRLFRLETAEGQVYALKSYPRQASDPRDRLATEFNALSFLRRHGVTAVPSAIARDDAAGFALYEWVEGTPVRPSTVAVDAAADFVRALHPLARAPDAAALPLASEACLSGESVVRQVEERLAKLAGVARSHPDLQEFLDAAFAPAAERAVTQARKIFAQAGLDFERPLAPSRRCLSPSDFGFHNALQAEGRVVFLDFEYFGWDDPVKLASDFVLHPGMDLTADLKQRFLDAMHGEFEADAAFAARLRALLPLYALRWTMILLNEFLPERWARRVMAGAQGNRADILSRQLGKARAMTARLESGSLESRSVVA
jgi:aminoglycoside phosphotransferase (APT) family kinase protein